MMENELDSAASVVNNGIEGDPYVTWGVSVAQVQDGRNSRNYSVNRTLLRATVSLQEVCRYAGSIVMGRRIECTRLRRTLAINQLRAGY